MRNLPRCSKPSWRCDENDLTQAETELRWVLEHKPSAEIRALTQLRLARVLHAKGDDNGALALLDETKAASYESAYLQLKGDIALAEAISKRRVRRIRARRSLRKR